MNNGRFFNAVTKITLLGDEFDFQGGNTNEYL